MAKSSPVAFPLEQFTTRPGEVGKWPVKIGDFAAEIDDAGTVKMGQGGAMPFAQHSATQDSRRVKFGSGGGIPFARHVVKVKIGAGGGMPFARH
jgi:hypothetical protein